MMDVLNTRKPKYIIENIISAQKRHRYSEVPETTVVCILVKLLTMIKYGPRKTKMNHSQVYITLN